jgi:YVTN family beta-propeller protein
VAVSPDGTRAYVTNLFGDSVSVINTASNSVAATITVGSNSFGVAVSPDGTRAYVTNRTGNSVSVINTTTNAVTGSPIPVGGGPFGVAVSPDGTRAYVTNSDSVSVINTASNTVTATITVGDGPAGVAVSPDGTRAYVTNFGSDAVSVINTASNTVTATITVGDEPVGVAVFPDGTRAYVTNNASGTVSVLALQPSAPRSVVATAGDSHLEVAWEVPAFTGGQPISSYTATASPGGETCTSSGATGCTISGLTNGTAYTATVTATNSIGTSAPSDPSAPVTPRAELTVSPATVAFADQRVGTTSSPQTVTVTNTGISVFRFATDAVSVSGAEPGAFGIDDGCSGTRIAAGESCTIDVRFSPTTAGTKTADLGFVSDAAFTPDRVRLSGTGVQPVFSASPDTVVFAAQTVGSTSPPQTVTVTNSGTADLRVPANAVMLAGTDPGAFAVDADGCSASNIAPGGICAVQVSFAPTVTGDLTASLVFTSDAPGSPHAVTLSGTGTAAPTPPPVGKQKQTLSAKLPKRIKRSGTTVITVRNARTNAGQRVRTIIRGGPVKAAAAGEVRYFTVIRGKKGKVSIRTYGYPNLKFKVTQKAPSTSDYKRFKRTAVYVRGTKR